MTTAPTNTLTFAHISDIHISSLGDHDDLLAGRAVEIFADIIDTWNQMSALDFVLIGGDLFDTADLWEFNQFQRVIKTLNKPCYIIPGNHDRRPFETTAGLTGQDFSRQFNPQFEQRPANPQAQAGYWSQAIRLGVQLIGLDSNRDKDWGGIIDDQQLTWLRYELDQHTDKLVILTIHHPLHSLHAIDDNPNYKNFVCDNGPELLALLDEHPQVKLVLTAHHHLCKADKLDQRWHLANPSIVIYPCAYRMIQLTQQSTGWHLQWDTYTVVDEDTEAEARQRLWDSLLENNFTAEFAEEYLATVYGQKQDRAGEVTWHVGRGT